MSTVVKTYRVTKESLKVGNSVRLYNDLIPEAEGWPNKEAYLRARQIEVIYLSEDEIATREEERLQRDKAVLEATSPVSKATPKPKKKVVRRSNGKRRDEHTADGDSDGDGESADDGSATGKQLSEQSI